MKMIMHCMPLADVVGQHPVPSTPRRFLRSMISWVPIKCFLDLQFGLVDWTCCLCSFRCPLAVWTVGVRCSLILVVVSPGKLINHPLSAACSNVLIGGAPRHLWQYCMSNGTVLMVICLA